MKWCFYIHQSQDSDCNAEFSASCCSIGLPEIIKDAMGVAAAGNHITGIVFV